jgi:DNA adenine methylase
MDLYRQTALFPEISGGAKAAAKPVNVASVHQHSPFRYPGGKTWFVPTFRKWADSLGKRPRLLVEPFAGGGIISLTALFENIVEEAVMAEIDSEIAAVWKCVVEGNAPWLADRILGFDLTHESLAEELQVTHNDTKEKAFQTILKNRTCHGGILAKGSGILKHGENGKGIRSRWYPITLARRLTNLSQIAYRIHFFEKDGIEVIHDYSERNDTIFFIDPPYTAGGKRAGRRLYNHCELDHEHLFKSCETIKGHFLMTYDRADEVIEMAKNHGFDFRYVPMKNTHHAEMNEIIIGKDMLLLDEN